MLLLAPWPSLSEDDIFDRTRTGSLLGVNMNFAGPENLAAMKIFAGNAKDLEDAKGILSVSGEQMDIALLRKLTARFNREATKSPDTI